MFHAGPCASETRSRAEAPPAVRNSSGLSSRARPKALPLATQVPGGARGSRGTAGQPWPLTQEDGWRGVGSF